MQFGNIIHIIGAVASSYFFYLFFLALMLFLKKEAWAHSGELEKRGAQYNKIRRYWIWVALFCISSRVMGAALSVYRFSFSKRIIITYLI